MTGASTMDMLLRRLQHLRVIPEKEGDRGSLDIRDLVDGVSCTIGYARNAEFADSLNRTFEIAREILAMPPEARDLKVRTERLAMAPGDILVMKTDRSLPAEIVMQIGDALRKFLPNTRLIVLEPGFSLEALSKEQLDRITAAVPA